MIASLRGRVVARGTDHVVVEVGGLGYKVFVPRPPEREEVQLHTHQVVREDGHFLYGFASREELALFELLIGVSGVGPKAAMAILSVSRPADVAAAIATGDAAALARAPGVGKKTAERLIVDLKGKVAGIAARGGEPAAPGDEVGAALVSLGFTPAEAAEALRSVPPAGAAAPAERLAAALRLAGRAAARPS
ncbi:MAG TPA: Holliday junction branch migration protein RuvA [Candidatus Limnocylindria bacterium]|nr:Holliday junction branch migration protein RuvA [Candidatus Limnocylindria bacterium]